MSRKILYVGKYEFHVPGGNMAAIHRLLRGLERTGIEGRYLRVGGPTDERRRTLDGFTPGLVHAFHAGSPAAFGLYLRDEYDVPLVITLTGTDMVAWLGGDGTIDAHLRAADALVALNEQQAEDLLERLPDARVVVVRQRIDLGNATFRADDLQEAGAAPRRALLLGGLRAVKGQRTALDVFERHAGALEGWHLVIAGPDAGEGSEPGKPSEYSLEIQRRAAALDNATYIGSVPRNAVPSLMGRCEALLNCSESEGESHAILEAMMTGLPVVASRVRGNVELVQHDRTGLLFDGSAELVAALGTLKDRTTAERLAAAAKAATEDRRGVDLELRGYVSLYSRTLQSRQA